jgi:AraC-like DNA-binding protein
MATTPSVLSCAESRIAGGGRTSRHSHPGCELIAVFAGEALVTCGRRRFRLVPGTVLALPAGCEHDQDNLTPVRQTFAVLDLAGLVPPPRAELHRCDADEPVLRWIVDLVRLHHASGGTGRAESALITAIIARLDQLAGRGGAPVRSLPPPLAISASHLRALSRKHLGVPPEEMRRLIRLRLAQKLLRTSHLSIAQVAEAGGWEDANYFARYFRSRTGMSPRAFRAAYRDG